MAGVVALSAFGEGMANGFEKVFSATGADLTVSQKDAIMTFFSALDEEAGAEIAQVPGVQRGHGHGDRRYSDAPSRLTSSSRARTREAP